MEKHFIEDNRGDRYEVDPKTGDLTPAPKHDGGPLEGPLNIPETIIKSVFTRD